MPERKDWQHPQRVNASCVIIVGNGDHSPPPFLEQPPFLRLLPF